MRTGSISLDPWYVVAVALGIVVSFHALVQKTGV